MKGGKRLGGAPPRRGGRLTGPAREPTKREFAPQVLLMLAFGCLVLGGVTGFALGMDRQLRGGILRQREEAMQRPDWVALEALPEYVATAFAVVVDPGFDEGATRPGRRRSIPRELVREIHLLQEGMAAEARELAMAPILEQRASPTQILELYLNRVPLGASRGYPVYGLYYAASEYLGKPATELTLGEAATLAGLLLEPRIEDPDLQAGAVGVRRNEVLRTLLAAGEISPEQYSSAVAERLAFQPGLTELPMSRRIPTANDTVVIRLPPAYRTLPAEPNQGG